MPIYEYECSACGKRHEALQKISDRPLVRCPSCGRETLKRLVSAAGFRLAGEGWYETDFKSKNRRNVAAGDNAPSGDSAGAKSGEAKEAKSGNVPSETPKKKTPETGAGDRAG